MAWIGRTTHRSLPVSIASGPLLPKLPVEPLSHVAVCRKSPAGEAAAPSILKRPQSPGIWTLAKVSMGSCEPGKEAVAAPAPSLPGLSDTPRRTSIASGTVMHIGREYTFVAAKAAVSASPEDAAHPSAILPGCGEDQLTAGKIGPCAAAVVWDPCVPAAADRRLLKMLPIRRGPVLPAPRQWPRLGAPPR